MNKRAAFIEVSIRQRMKDGMSHAMARHLARVEWDRKKAGAPLSVELPSPSSLAVTTSKFAERSKERQGPRRRRFLAFLRSFPMPKATWNEKQRRWIPWKAEAAAR